MPPCDLIRSIAFSRSDLARLALDRIGDAGLAATGAPDTDFVIGEVGVDQTLGLFRRPGTAGFLDGLAVLDRRPAFDQLGAQVVAQVLGDGLVEGVGLAVGQGVGAAGIGLRNLDLEGDVDSADLAADLALDALRFAGDFHVYSLLWVGGVARGW